MITGPQVLIWITCRNYEHYLPLAIKSAHDQSYPCTVHVSHDDCGGDNPVGVAANRNRAIVWPSAAAVDAFDYVVFLDADDELPPNYVAELLKTAAGDPCVVTCGARYFGERSGRIEVQTPVNLETLLELNTVHCSALLPVKPFLEAGGFDESLPAFEDWELWCRMASRGVEFRHTDKTWLLYRQHEGSRHHTKTVDCNAMREFLISRFRRAGAGA